MPPELTCQLCLGSGRTQAAGRDPRVCVWCAGSGLKNEELPVEGRPSVSSILSLISNSQVVRFEVHENGFPEVVPIDSEKLTGTTTVYEVTINEVES